MFGCSVSLWLGVTLLPLSRVQAVLAAEGMIPLYVNALLRTVNTSLVYGVVSPVPATIVDRAVRDQFAYVFDAFCALFVRCCT